MILGIDGSRLSVSQRTGTENYSAQIISHLAQIAAPDTLRVYLRTAATPEFLRDLPNVEVVPIPFRRFWTHARLSWEMILGRPDVLFVPAHVVPLAHPRTVVTVHDLGYLHHPESHPPAQRRMLDLSTRWSIRAARHVIAISESTRRDLIGAYGVSAAKITTVAHGTEPPHPITQEQFAEARTRLGLPDHYVLTVGTIQPRKNLPRLVEAMNRVAEAGLPHRLLIAGKQGWMADKVFDEICRADRHSRAIHLGYVSDSDLRSLYAGASAFALPSLYEGFGLPALDALAAGLPTLLSDRSALPEVAGSAAVYVNPMDADSIGSALNRLLTDDALRANLARVGPERASLFRWHLAAERTLTILRTVAASTSP